MKSPFRICTVLAFALAAHNSSAVAQSDPPPESAYEICIKGNADNRKSVEAAPGMPEATMKLGLLLMDDRICDCIKNQETKADTEASNDPMIRFFSANSVCMTTHVNKEFPPMCPNVYRDLLPLMGYRDGTAEEVAKVCACGADVMKSTLTPANLLQSQLEHYRYFNALVEDRKNKTHKADAMPRPGLGPFERGVQGIQGCALKVLGEPKRVAPDAKSNGSSGRPAVAPARPGLR